MIEITKAEMNVILAIVKSPEIEYNANNLASNVGITSMGALNILKRLEKEHILKSRKVGKATIYRINTQSEYACRYVSLILSREALHASVRVRRWVTELKKINHASIIILFGSVLHQENPGDIDVLLVTDKKNFQKLQEEINRLNKINIKKLHPIYQTLDEITENIKIRHKPLLDAIKGIIVKGEEKFIEVYDESRKE
jgi:predicted nucleotidyltransferase